MMTDLWVGRSEDVWGTWRRRNQSSLVQEVEDQHDGNIDEWHHSDINNNNRKERVSKFECKITKSQNNLQKRKNIFTQKYMFKNRKENVWLFFWHILLMFFWFDHDFCSLFKGNIMHSFYLFFLNFILIIFSFPFSRYLYLFLSLCCCSTCFPPLWGSLKLILYHLISSSLTAAVKQWLSLTAQFVSAGRMGI